MLLLLGVLAHGYAVSVLPFVGTNPNELNPDYVQSTPFDQKPYTSLEYRCVRDIGSIDGPSLSIVSTTLAVFVCLRIE